MAENQTKPSGSAGSPVEGPRFVVCERCDGIGADDCGDCPDCGGPDCAPGVRDTRPTPVEPGGGGSGVEVSDAECIEFVAGLAQTSDAGWAKLEAVRDGLRAAYAERERMQTGDGSPMTALRAALAHVEDQDCGDNSCLFARREKRGGMRTNGGCRCVPYERGALTVGTVARIVKAARMVVARPQAPGVKP